MLLAPKLFLRHREPLLSALLVLNLANTPWVTRGSFLTAPLGQAWPAFCVTVLLCPPRWAPLLILGVGHRTRFQLFVPVQLAGLLFMYWGNGAAYAALLAAGKQRDPALLDALAAVEARLEGWVPAAGWLRQLDWQWLGANTLSKVWALQQLLTGFLIPAAYVGWQEFRELSRAPGCLRRPCLRTACALWLLAAAIAVTAVQELGAVQACTGGQPWQLLACLPVVPLAQ